MNQGKRYLIGIFVSVLCFFGWQPLTVWSATYQLDPVHSTIGFSVSHMMVSTTRGGFSQYEGTIDFDAGMPEQTKINVTIQANSIDTRNEKRDNHLRAADFLDVANHPVITFISTKVVKEGDRYLVSGDLTIHGVTKPVTIPLTINGPVKSPFGANVIGLSGQVTINRQDFGVSFNKQMDQGGLMVGNDVLIDVQAEAQQK
jgi:polyisoprenoid-binding protein YceI